MNGVGVGTEERSTLNAEIWCDQKTLLWTVMMVLVEMFPLREAVQE